MLKVMLLKIYNLHIVFNIMLDLCALNLSILHIMICIPLPLTLVFMSFE